MDDMASLKKQLANVTRERDNLRMVAQRTAAHCEALVKQLQEAKEELSTIKGMKTAAPHEEEEQSPGREAMRIDNLKTMQPQALAEMQRPGSSSPAPVAGSRGASQSPGSGDHVSIVVKGWSNLCSTGLIKGADWLYTAKGAERHIDRILGQYYEPELSPLSRGAKGKKETEGNPKVALDKIAQVIDGRMKQLRRQEDELQNLMTSVQQWDTQSRVVITRG